MPVISSIDDSPVLVNSPTLQVNPTPTRSYSTSAGRPIAAREIVTGPVSLRREHVEEVARVEAEKCEEVARIEAERREIEAEIQKEKERLVSGLDNEDLNALLRVFDKVSHSIVQHDHGW